ncbi:Synemin [Tupaia chinensis]|uniref:Synemin n=1 Tax=Tupaia chinensis TaxID=246437 RepID=L8YD33_TUPCH|nr:Synemin [Tupaia chinensis]
MLFDSKEKASEERNLRWEELTKLDKEARKREMQQMNEKAKGKDALKERHVKGRDIPIHLEGPQARRPAEVTPKGLQMPVKKDADDGSGRQKETREARFKLSPSDPADSLEGDSTTETVAENIVTSILKQFTQTSNTEATANSFPDTKVIYVEKKELPGDKKTKTEIVLESKLTEDVDISDQAGLDYLLSKEAKEVGLKGKSTEQMIGDIINLGLKGRDGRARVVNVEIVEEPMSYVGGEKAGEFSTPFEVEEVDDVSPDPKRFTEEEGSYGETDGTFLGHPRHRTRQENVTHFEEVMEAGDSEGEQSYFVSTPEEHPGGPDRDDDEGSVYGQIHIEEESTIRYSWQDEIVQGSWRRRKQGDHEGEIMNVPEASPADAERTHWTEQSRSGEFHAEPTITEKEIKIPHEFHASIKGVSSKEPRHQLVEVIGQLEQTLPERVKEELSALTREEDSELGGVSVDVKKVQTPGSGSVTLVAEVNLSQTVDADQLDVEQLSRDEASEIEKTVESVVRDNVTRRQGQAPGSPDRDERMESPVSGLGFKRWATRELYSPSGEREDGGRASYSMEQLSPQGPVSATVEVSSPQGFAQSVRHVQLGPTAFWKTEQVSYEGPTVQVAQVSGEDVPSQAAILVGTSLSLRPLMLGLEPSQVSREVFLQGPIPFLQEVGSAEELEAPDLSTDANLSGKQGSFGFQQVRVEKAAIVQGSTSGAGKVGDESASTQTSVSHLQVGPKHGFSEPIQLTVPLSDRTGLGIKTGSVNTEGSSGIHTSVSHISITPRGHQGAEWVVDPGLVPHPVEFRDPDSAIPLQSSAAVTQVTTTHTLGSKTFMTEKSTFQRVALESPREDGSGDTSGADVTSGVSRSFRHIQLGPTDTDTSEHIVIRAPASVTRGLAGSARLPERGDPADGSRTLRLIDLGPKETSFTFQMDVSNVEATPRWTPGAGTEGEAPSASGWGAWRDAGSTCDPASGTSFQAAAGDRHQAQGEQHTEEATFDKTVQLQRMVDQRSVISDDKKVALLYLDKEEEEDDGHWF